MQKHISIRWKIGGLIILVVIAQALVMGLFLPARVAEDARAALRERARAEAALLADAVAPALDLLTGQEEEILRASLADPLVAWAAIYGPQGERLAQVGTHASLSAHPVDHGEGPLVSSWVEAMSAPVRRDERSLGWVAVALKTEGIIARHADTRNSIIMLALIVGIAGILFAIFISQRIARPLARVTEAAGRVAGGDVSRDVDVKASNDEVGELAGAFNTMTKRLRELAQRIGDSSESLASAAAGMFSEVREQEALATQQTASLEEIRRTLSTLADAADQVAHDADAVRDMAMSNLESSQQIAARTRLVSEHSDRIGEILSLIQDIADKSDLLALNAALEGTKAGEVGRGFSLVAAEMRRLSEHVVDSVRDIRKLIADTREASHASVLATEEGIKLSQETAAAAAKISDAVTQQREGTTQVKASADEIVRAVNESLRGRGDTTRAAEGLLQLSQELKDAVSAFRLESGEGA